LNCLLVSYVIRWRKWRTGHKDAEFREDTLISINDPGPTLWGQFVSLVFPEDDRQMESLLIKIRGGLRSTVLVTRHLRAIRTIALGSLSQNSYADRIGTIRREGHTIEFGETHLNETIGKVVGTDHSQSLTASSISL